MSLPIAHNNGAQATRLLRVKDGARRLALAERTVRALIARGRIKAVRIGGSIRISQAEIERISVEGA